MNQDKHPAMRGLWAIVLAAGASTRLGRPKQLERFRNRPLLVHAVRLAATVCGDRVVVVLGANRLRLRATLRRSGLAAMAAVNPRWQRGIGASLARGIDLLPADALAAMILLTDQPLVTTADLERLATRWRRRRGIAAAAEYAGRPGVPAILPRSVFRRLSRLDGDSGARQLLRNLPALERVSMPNAAFDVDTEAQASQLRRSRLRLARSAPA